MRKPKILQISHHTAYPPTSGGEHRVHGLLSADGRFDKTRWVFQHSPDGEKEGIHKKQIGDDYTELIYYSGLRKRVHNNIHEKIARTDIDNDLIGLCLVINEYRLLKHISDDSNLDDLMNKADIIQIEYPWLFPYFFRNKKNKTKIIYSSHNDEVEYHNYLPDSLPGRYIKWTIKRRERAAVEKSDAVVVVSERDISRYQDRGWKVGEHVVCRNGTPRVPNSADPSNGLRVGDINDASVVCIFVGTDHQPNRVAIDEIISFAGELASDDIHIEILGSVCQRYTDTPENVHLCGFVDELEPYLLGADIGLNPTTLGGGSNIKLAEYLAYGLPVVSTPFGSRGFESGTDDVFLTSDIGSFPDVIKELSSDAELRRALGQRARTFAIENLRWDNISEKLFDYYNQQFLD
ncbi:glycosyltransferase family 4 protein [Haloarcula litorea]|uniref:glycosyltransferase family 4 protein n=1 Tax=Haloarcula litorea TaxID=3032579 RepID=UPI0023E7794A|nr:glycosyltransferase family 4 protein [Halomicroarcula sp. GDY20]